MSRPSRDMEQYRDVENFRQYELTNNLIYEMAIRNDEAQKVIELFLKDYVEKDSERGEVILSSLDLNEYAGTLQGYGFSPFQLYLDYHFFDRVNENLKRIKADLEEQRNEAGKKFNDYADEQGYERKNLREVFKQDKYAAELDYEHSMLDDMLMRFESILFRLENFEHKYTPEDQEKTAKLLERELPPIRKWSTYTASEFFETCTVYKEGVKRDFADLFSERERNEDGDSPIKYLSAKWVKPRYSRPTLGFGFETSRIVDVKLDLSLPEDDLVDFIKIVKQQHKTMIKNPVEILGGSVEDGELPSVPKKDAPMRWADIFFIYDLWKELEKEGFNIWGRGGIIDTIQEYLTNYHFYEGHTFRRDVSEWMSADTVNGYFKTITPYIKDKKYLQLLGFSENP